MVIINLHWCEGLVLNHTGYGLVNGVTFKTTVGGVEAVDGTDFQHTLQPHSHNSIKHRSTSCIFFRCHRDKDRCVRL